MAKDAIRTWIVAELKAIQPTRVADLWGGGASAAVMAAAGLNVISVDDGRAIARDEMQAAGIRDGYATHLGRVEDVLAECDAAWLDFCGQWCPEYGRILDQCRHLQALLVTVMGERTPITDSRISPQDWCYAIEGMIVGHTEMRVHVTRKYQRPAGNWVNVVFLKRNVSLLNSRLRARRVDPLMAKTAQLVRRERKSAQDRARRMDPEVRDAKAIQDRMYYLAHHDEILAQQREYNHQHREASMAKYRAAMADPARRQAKRDAEKVRRLKRLGRLPMV